MRTAPPDQAIASPGVIEQTVGFEAPLEGGPGAEELAELDPNAVDPRAGAGRPEPGADDGATSPAEPDEPVR
jgi:hypothetical protein